MSKRNRKQPAVPADITARRAEKRELKARGLEVNVDPRDEKIVGIWRPDCFNLLLKNSPAEAAAVQWLEELIRTASGENGQERRPDFIRSSSIGAPGQNVSQSMIDADDMLSAVTEHMAPRDARMLFELLKPDEALLTRWRDVVQRCTGETNPQAQGGAVRAACAHLAHIRTISDRLLRDRKNRRAEAMAA
jgi:hypothetical protein